MPMMVHDQECRAWWTQQYANSASETPNQHSLGSFEVYSSYTKYMLLDNLESMPLIIPRYTSRR
jgi:hypothetical protein